MDNAFLSLFFENKQNSGSLLHGFISRRAILNSKGFVVAYEITYKDPKFQNNGVNSTTLASPDSLFTDSVLLFGMLEFSSKKLALLNVPKRFLKAETPLILPSEQVVIALNLELFDENELARHIENLEANHFRFYSDSFTGDDQDSVIRRMDYVKLDFDSDINKIRQDIASIKALHPHCQVIIQNVNTYLDYDLLADLDVDLFQGDYFSTPQKIKFKDFKFSSNSISELLSMNLDEDFDFTKIAQVVKKDIAMTSRFLRLANNAGRKKMHIHSIDHALIYLGQYEVKKVITLFILTESANNKPEELCKQALIRAKFCEAVIKLYDPDKSFQAYLVGLLSVLDAIFDFPIDKILPSLGLNDECNRAIIAYEGILGLTLETVIQLSKNDFKSRAELANTINVPETDLHLMYLHSLLSTDYIFNND